MAEDSETLTIRMLRITGKNENTQWFEYRPSFMVDIVRIEWELDTMDVELDTPIAEHLLQRGYAAPAPQGSRPVAPAPAPPPPAPKKTKQAPPPPPPEKPDNPATDSSPPPSAPSWLKPGGDEQGE